MDCPRCGLINPETAQRCDCGYDFQSRTVQKSFDTPRRLPGSIVTYLAIAVPLNVVVALWAFLSTGDRLRLMLVGIWSFCCFFLFMQLVGKRNWARYALAVLTFPLGAILLLNREVRAYCYQQTSE